MKFEDMIFEFSEKHPVLTWALSRLAICICGGLIAALGFFALIAACAPFVYIADGAGWGAFATWLWLPLIATVIWLMVSVIRYVWEEVIGA